MIPGPGDDEHGLPDSVAIADSMMRSSRLGDLDDEMTDIPEEDLAKVDDEQGSGGGSVSDTEDVNESEPTVEDKAPIFDEDEQDDTSGESHSIPPASPVPPHRASFAGDNPKTEVP
jgi:hypothetical protein